ncbi:MAG: hypothetical protein ACSHW4_16135, partial [Cellulophaga sp.]
MQLKIKNKTKHKKGTIFNWGLLLLLTISITNNVWSQNSINTNLEHQQDTIIKSQAEKDWEHFNYMKNLFATPEEHKRY